MRVSDKIKAVLLIRGKKLADLADYFGIKPQSMSNKVTRNNWTAEELLKIADFCGCKVAFVFPSGEQVYLEGENKENPDT